MGTRIHHKLYVARRENRLKQKDVAKKIGIHPQSYHLKESGKRDFTIPEARRLARVFNCTLNDLFQEEEYEHAKKLNNYFLCDLDEEATASDYIFFYGLAGMVLIMIIFFLIAIGKGVG